MLKMGYAINRGQRRFGTTISYQPETTAFLNALPIINGATIYFPSTPQQITGAGIWNALDSCIVEIKIALGLLLGANNLSNKFKFIFPRIGGTATTNSYNLTNATQNGTFFGGWTHDSTGSLPNGVNAYMTTGFLYNATNFSRNNQFFGFFSKTNTDGLYSDYGSLAASGGGVNCYTSLGSNMNTRLAVAGVNNTTAITSSLGFISMSRTAGATYKHYKEGLPIGTITQASDVMPVTGLDISEAASNANGAILQFSPRKRTWFLAGDGMTDVQMLNVFNAINNFETTLNR
jgi:hypothetical protein